MPHVSTLYFSSKYTINILCIRLNYYLIFYLYLAVMFHFIRKSSVILLYEVAYYESYSQLSEHLNIYNCSTYIMF